MTLPRKTQRRESQYRNDQRSVQVVVAHLAGGLRHPGAATAGCAVKPPLLAALAGGVLRTHRASARRSLRAPARDGPLSASPAARLRSECLWGRGRPCGARSRSAPPRSRRRSVRGSSSRDHRTAWRASGWVVCQRVQQHVGFAPKRPPGSCDPPSMPVPAPMASVRPRGHPSG